MRAPNALPLCVVATTSLAVLACSAQPEASAPTPTELAEAGELFRASCASCHAPPDPAFENDRAWLHQVHDTA